MLLSKKWLGYLFILIASCHPGQEVKDALEAQKKQDSLLQEFKKVNEEIKKSGTHMDSVNHWLDSVTKAKDSTSYR